MAEDAVRIQVVLAAARLSAAEGRFVALSWTWWDR